MDVSADVTLTQSWQLHQRQKFTDSSLHRQTSDRFVNHGQFVFTTFISYTVYGLQVRKHCENTACICKSYLKM